MVRELYYSLTLDALSAILMLALIAMGLMIIFGFMGVINLAHGAFLTLGAYTVWFVSTDLGLPFWVGLAVAPVAVGLVGLLIESLVLRHLYDRMLDTILATWGIAIVVREVIKIVFDTGTKGVSNPLPMRLTFGPATYPAYRVFIIGTSALILVGIFVLFFRTLYGVRLRAVIQNEEAAAALGLDQRRIYMSTFALGAGLAGFAGGVISPLSAVQPDMGLSYLIESFLAVILGGMGSFLGVVAGSAVVGGLMNLFAFWISAAEGQVIVYVIIVSIVALRPLVSPAVARWWSR